MTDRALDLRTRIVAAYGPGPLRRSALNIRDGGGVFEWALGQRRVRCALEIGTYRGVSAAALALYCDRVITIDLARGKLEAHGEQWDRRAFWNRLGLRNIEFHAVRDDEEKARLVAGLDFDFAFIDGAHDARVRSDFDLVKRCGNVLFHDADDRGPGASSNCVFEFLSTLPREQMQVMDIFALWTA